MCHSPQEKTEMRTTNQKTTTELQAPPAPQPNEGQTASGCGENQEQKREAAWAPAKDGNGEVIITDDRYTSISQYLEGAYCVGKWHWGTWSKNNSNADVGGVVDTEEEAREKAEQHHAMTDDELIEIRAERLLYELRSIGWKPRTNLAYATGYDDGYKAALAKLTEFLNIEHKE